MKNVPIVFRSYVFLQVFQGCTLQCTLQTINCKWFPLDHVQSTWTPCTLDERNYINGKGQVQLFSRWGTSVGNAASHFSPFDLPQPLSLAFRPYQHTYPLPHTGGAGNLSPSPGSQALPNSMWAGKGLRPVLTTLTLKAWPDKNTKVVMAMHKYTMDGSSMRRARTPTYICMDVVLDPDTIYRLLLLLISILLSMPAPHKISATFVFSSFPLYFRCSLMVQ